MSYQIAVDKSQVGAGFIAYLGILCIPVKLAVFMYTKVFGGGDKNQ